MPYQLVAEGDAQDIYGIGSYENLYEEGAFGYLELRLAFTPSADIIQNLEGLKIRAFDVVEANPKYDCSGITFVSTSKFIREMLGLNLRHTLS